MRDILLGLSPSDVDLATDATPEQVGKIVRQNDGISFAKGPKAAHRFGSFKVLYDALPTVGMEYIGNNMHGRMLVSYCTFRPMSSFK